MVKSVIDRVEQAQLAELFTALESAAPAEIRLAESVTFWRYQLLIGVEPSQVAELLAILDEAAELSTLGEELRRDVLRWRPILESRARLAEPWRMPSDGQATPASRGTRDSEP